MPWVSHGWRGPWATYKPNIKAIGVCLRKQEVSISVRKREGFRIETMWLWVILRGYRSRYKDRARWWFWNDLRSWWIFFSSFWSNLLGALGGFVLSEIAWRDQQSCFKVYQSSMYWIYSLCSWSVDKWYKVSWVGETNRQKRKHVKG